jgi:hypothetical protein
VKYGQYVLLPRLKPPFVASTTLQHVEAPAGGSSEFLKSDINFDQVFLDGFDSVTPDVFGDRRPHTQDTVYETLLLQLTEGPTTELVCGIASTFVFFVRLLEIIKRQVARIGESVDWL